MYNINMNKLHNFIVGICLFILLLTMFYLRVDSSLDSFKLELVELQTQIQTLRLNDETIVNGINQALANIEERKNK